MSDATKQKSFGKNQKAILDALKSGTPLHKLFLDGGTVFVLGDSKEVSKESVERLIARGVLAENQDGMFGTGMSYRLAGEAV